MTPGTVTAIAYLITEAVSAGVSISAIISEAKATGKVPPERWDSILADLDANVAAWKAR